MGKPTTTEMLALERALWRSGLGAIAGVDEVGVGPLAGPVVAAAVILPPDAVIEGVHDSKTLSRKRREALDGVIRQAAAAVGLGVVSAEEVDRLNPYQAGLRAMALAVLDLGQVPDHLLVDAREIPGTSVPQTSIVAGDRKVRAIAAASIVAKVYRDDLMVSLDKAYPDYGFGRHMGYGTRAHLEALHRLGPCPAHRQSYAPVREAAERHRPGVAKAGARD